MSTIRVRVKSTGQTGTVDSSEFNPALFEQLGSQQSTLGSLGSGALGLLSGLFQAPQRLGEGLGQVIKSPFENRRLQQERETDSVLQEILDRRASRTNDPEQLAQLSQQGQRIAQRGANQQANFGRELEKGFEDTVKGGVGTAALGLPGGSTGTSKVLSSILSGAGSGFGASEDGQELSSTAGGAVVGGAVGLAGQLFSKLANRGSKATPKTKGSKLKSDPFFVKNREQLRNTARELGIADTNTATQNLQILEDSFNATKQQVDDLLSGSRVDDETLINKLAEALDNSNFNPNSKSQNQRLNSYLQKLAETNGDGAALNSLKSELRGQLSNAFTKINKGTTLTAQEEVAMAVYKAIQESLDTVSPQIRQLNSLQKSIYDLADEFGTTIKKDKGAQFKLPIGSNVPLPFSQEQARTAGAKGGSLLKGIVNAPIQAGAEVGEQGVLRNLLSANAVNKLSQTPNAPQETPLPAGPTTQDVQKPGSMLQGILTPEMLAIGVLSGDISASDAKYLQSLLGGGGDKAGEIATIENNLNELESQLQGQTGGILGGITSLASNIPGVASDARVFKATRQAFTGPIARVISQEVGVLTDRDVKRAQDILPALSDTPTERADKIAVLRRAIANLKSGNAMSPEGQAYLNSGNNVSLDSLFSQ